MTYAGKTKRLGTMIDFSRNGVMTVDALKKWIDLTGDMGYNTVLLYMEDTYEVNENPYFGYARGRYTKDEMKEIADTKPGFIRAMWCGDRECEDKLKEVAGVTSRCIPFEQEQLDGKCVCCGKEAKHMLYWGKAY